MGQDASVMFSAAQTYDRSTGSRASGRATAYMNRKTGMDFSSEGQQAMKDHLRAQMNANKPMAAAAATVLGAAAAGYGSTEQGQSQIEGQARSENDPLWNWYQSGDRLAQWYNSDELFFEEARE
jgi:hypothetical protein